MNPEPVKRPKSAGQNGKRGSPADVTEAALGKGPCGAPFAKGQPENDHFGEATPGGEMPATTERSASKGSASRTESASRTDSIAQPQTTVSKAANEKESAGALVLHTVSFDLNNLHKRKTAVIQINIWPGPGHHSDAGRLTRFW